MNDRIRKPPARRLILVSNRLPLTLTANGDQLRYVESIGGVATGLGTVLRKYRHMQPLWIGATNLAREDVCAAERTRVEKELREKEKCVPLFLPREVIDGYYNGFSNSVLWPLFHGLLQRPEAPTLWWEQYQAANQLFLDKVLEVAAPNDIVWVNDYHLLLLPRLIKRARAIQEVGLFLHTAIPDRKAFRRLVVGEDLIAGIRRADQIGVYTERYRRRLVESLQPDEPRVGVFQIGVDPDRIDRLLETERVRDMTRGLRSRFDGKKVILSADRLDHSKGIPQKLTAYERLLVRHGELKGSIQLVLCVGPCRMEVESYRSLDEEISRRVLAINEKYRTDTWEPIEFIHRAMSYEELLALYRVADVSVVTPVEDGMNLMAKEYLYVKGNEGGALILSDKAGAAVELQGAYSVDPANLDEIVEALSQSLRADPRELAIRNQSMVERLSVQTAAKWAGDFIAALEGPRSPAGAPSVSPALRP